MNNGGDTLARGGHRCAFPPAGGNVTQEKWDSIFGEDSGPKKNNSDANQESTGNVGSVTGETGSGS